MNPLEDTYTDEKARGIGSVAAERWQDTWLVLSVHASQRYFFAMSCNVFSCIRSSPVLLRQLKFYIKDFLMPLPALDFKRAKGTVRRACSTSSIPSVSSIVCSKVRFSLQCMSLTLQITSSSTEIPSLMKFPT